MRGHLCGTHFALLSTMIWPCQGDVLTVRQLSLSLARGDAILGLHLSAFASFSFKVLQVKAQWWGSHIYCSFWAAFSCNSLCPYLPCLVILFGKRGTVSSHLCFSLPSWDSSLPPTSAYRTYLTSHIPQYFHSPNRMLWNVYYCARNTVLYAENTMMARQNLALWNLHS